ncbi:MAG: CDP-diacylglycerol--serine O-phosphatidyltransferase [Candidatus Omnitrophica bacterium CG11_big_fil_rev_8_21_14_0_20_45_26]|uniref:CDP-diacylglycerol--serine O-phosphatidyltransferase n=1 Tax=Candidatus Abzuiibacterium crystallinum TaxID=1974748 RepID=A0A2H0LRI4_9BACT|nr:MAG: CDP-diacylglycerol--serine O-phosphatidyltransferase [Candidatus Omnitrophica bacterium CG11_big_fil_rev_8_21_14_0_20_45_26]PIW65549.1 MAG: CDP-diacylglycerol--serine O-phosphatidyltransferase [Candidatus Omnitrophica bacterium CG12_big_fil_rev_8_21_14_0_65_45_16]
MNDQIGSDHPGLASWIPNILTFLNLCTGFLALLKIHQGYFFQAVWLIVLCLVWDSLDGNIARIFKVTSQLGRELDSLADAVSFVVAPTFLVTIYMWSQLDIQVLFFAGIFLVAGVYRLARFNLKPPVAYYFKGLPTPAAAIALSMTVLAHMKSADLHPEISNFSLLLLMILLSILMVSKVPYPKISALPFKNWQILSYASLIIFALTTWMVNLESGAVMIIYLFLAFSPFCRQPESPAVMDPSGAHAPIPK